MLLLGVNREQGHLNVTLGHAILNYVRHLDGAKDLVKRKGGVKGKKHSNLQVIFSLSSKS